MNLAKQRKICDRIQRDSGGVAPIPKRTKSGVKPSREEFPLFRGSKRSGFLERFSTGNGPQRIVRGRQSERTCCDALLRGGRFGLGRVWLCRPGLGGRGGQEDWGHRAVRRVRGAALLRRSLCQKAAALRPLPESLPHVRRVLQKTASVRSLGRHLRLSGPLWQETHPLSVPEPTLAILSLPAVRLLGRGRTPSRGRAAGEVSCASRDLAVITDDAEAVGGKAAARSSVRCNTSDRRGFLPAPANRRTKSC